jgi:hypothetical protein
MLLTVPRWSVRGSPEAPHYARPKHPQQPARVATNIHITSHHIKTQTISPHSYQQNQTEARKASPARATIQETTTTTSEKNHVAQKPHQNPRPPNSRRGPPPPHHHHHLRSRQRALSSSSSSLSFSPSPAGPGTNLTRRERRARGGLVPRADTPQ